MHVLLRIAFLLIAMPCLCGCGGNRPGLADADQAVTGRRIDPSGFAMPAIPAGYSILEQASGDLDGDGNPELVIGYTISERPDSGALRRLVIYRADGERWLRLYECAGALMPGVLDGQSEDPFKSLEVEDGCIVIHHAGAGRSPWDYLHRYRLNARRWELSSATIATGEPCDTFTTIDIRFAEGGVELNQERDNCDATGTEVPGQGAAKVTRFRIGKGPVPMDGFRPGANALRGPDGETITY